MVRGLAVAMAVAAAAASCGKGGDTGATQKPVEAAAVPKAVPADASAAAPRTDDKAPTATKAQRREYRKRLLAGRKLAGEKKWGEAVVQFEAALKAIPMDGRALSELGWAAFQAGDYAKARRANADAVRVAQQPNVKAASLYNLGRVAEATGDKAAAARLYAESILLRPNDTVTERLTGLGKKAPEPAAAAEKAPCGQPQPLEAICDCLKKNDENAQDLADPDFKPECTVEDRKKAGDAKIVRLDFSESESDFFVAVKVAKGWSVIGFLGYLYEGGIAGVSGELGVSKVEDKKVGAGRLLWIETVEKRSDSDMGIDEIEHSEERTLTLCVLESPKGGTPHCPLTVPLASSYTRERLGIMEEDEMDAEVRKLMTPGLPIHSELKLDVRIADDGTVTVTLLKGEATDALKPLLGEHELY